MDQVPAREGVWEHEGAWGHEEREERRENYHCYPDYYYKLVKGMREGRWRLNIFHYPPCDAGLSPSMGELEGE